MPRWQLAVADAELSSPTFYPLVPAAIFTWASSSSPESREQHPKLFLRRSWGAEGRPRRGSLAVGGASPE